MWRKTFLAVIVVIKVMALFASPAHAAVGTNMAEVRSIVEPSIVYVETAYTGRVYDEFYGQYVRQAPFTVTTGCTGFVVNSDGFIVTAGHCVDVDAEIRAMLIERAATWAYNNDYYQFDEGETAEDVARWALEDFRVEDTDGQVGTADVDATVFRPVADSGDTEWKDNRARVLEVMEFGEGDLGLLKIEATNLPAIELAPEGTIAVGSEVITIGYAGNVEAVSDVVASPSYKDGTVSSERTLDGGLVPIYEVSAALTSGMSGGPAVDSEGRVVGVNSFRITSETQQFNFISPVSMVSEIMASRNVDNELDAAAVAYREGVVALQAGDKAAALAGLEAAQQAWGSLAMVDTLWHQAQALDDPVIATTVPAGTDGDGSEAAGASTTRIEKGGEDGPGEETAGFGIVGVAAVGMVAVAAAGTIAYRRKGSRPGTVATPGPVGRLEQLKQLRDAGLIDDDTFEAAKAKAISELTGAGV